MFVSSKVTSLLTSAVLLSQASLTAGKNVELEGFGETLSHAWTSLTDPIIGGVSESKLSHRDGVILLEGRVEKFPTNSIPGFIGIRSSGGSFPDVNKCEGIMITMRSDTPYTGLYFSLGTKYFNDTPHLNGFRTKIDAPMGNYADVILPFSSFSDNWRPETGEVTVPCAENTDFCLDRETLSNLKRMELMAQGSEGDVKVEIDRIVAYSCDDDVVEVESDGSKFSINNVGALIKDTSAAVTSVSTPSKDTSSAVTTVSTPSDMAKAQAFLQNGIDSLLVHGVGAQGGWMRPTVLDNGDVLIESFVNPQHRWYAMSDGLMGGPSQASVKVENNYGILEGEVKPMTNGMSGFVKMETRGGAFPDLSTCTGLKIKMKSMTDHESIRVDLGGINKNKFNSGFRTKLEDIPVNEFGDVTVPFTDFSNSFDFKTGEIKELCNPSDHSHCIDKDTLRGIASFGISASIRGEVNIEMSSIVATDCDIPETWTIDTQEEVEAVVHVKGLAAPDDSSFEIGVTVIVLTSTISLVVGLLIGLSFGGIKKKEKKIEVVSAVDSDVEIA